MAITLEKVTKEVSLDLPEGLSKSEEKDIKKEVGDYLVTSILDYVGDGKSPVTGRNFKQLSKPYADEMKGGRRDPNLDLEGDMLNSLDYKLTSDGLEIGIFSKKEAPKAYNHNVGDTLPKRPFIPDEDQNFTGKIQRGIDEIISSRAASQERDEPRRREPRREPSDLRTTEEIRESRVSVSTAFGEDVLDRITRDILGG